MGTHKIGIFKLLQNYFKCKRPPSPAFFQLPPPDQIFQVHLRCINQDSVVSGRNPCQSGLIIKVTHGAEKARDFGCGCCRCPGDDTETSLTYLCLLFLLFWLRDQGWPVGTPDLLLTCIAFSASFPPIVLELKERQCNTYCWNHKLPPARGLCGVWQMSRTAVFPLKF